MCGSYNLGPEKLPFYDLMLWDLNVSAREARVNALLISHSRFLAF